MLLEREAELARVDAALRAADEGVSSLILLSGPLGSGRSALLRDLPALVAGEDVRVMRANAAAMETDFAFAVVRQLFDSLPAGVAERDHERGTREPDDDSGPVLTADDPAEILRGPRSLAAGASDRTRLLILVDDLQWADVPSLRWLAHLTRRMHGLRAVLVCALRDGDRRSRHPLVREVTDAATCVLRPAPLSLRATRAVIREEFGEAADEEYARACHEASRGNPLFLTSVVHEMRAKGLPPAKGQAEQARSVRPSALRERLASALRSQSPAVRDLAEAIAAFGDQGDSALTARLAGLDEIGFGAAHRALQDMGLLTATAEPRFVHRVVRDAVESTMAVAERERAHDTAADLLYESGSPAERVADHLMSVTTADRPWSATVLRSAADSALRRGAPETAVRYLRRALLGSQAQDEGRARLLTDLATAERDFDPGACERHIAQAIALFSTPGGRAGATLRIPPALLGTTSPVALGLLREAAAEMGDPASLTGAAREIALRVEARLRHHGHEDPAELASAAERLRGLGPCPPLDTAGERELMAALLCAGTLTGVLSAADAAKTANRILEREPATSARVHTMMPLVVITLFAAESVDGVNSWLSSEQQTRRQNATDADDVLLLAERALVLISQGRQTQAREHAERAMALDGTHWREASILVLSAVALDIRDPVLSERILARARGRDSAGLALTVTLRILQASVDAQRGLRRRALESLLACGRQLDMSGWRSSALFPWRPHAIGLHHRLGDFPSALKLAEEECAWAAAWGAPAGLGRALRLKGWLLGAEGVGLLREAVEVLRGSSYELELARTLALLGRRLGSGAEAAAALREASALAAACGAPWLVERAEHGLGTAAPPSNAVLTRSERRVITLVGRGLTNQEIASEIGVSSRAVEKHLTNSYRKLGVSGRHELADALPA
ncbi:ATP-binding protein [Streptomyces sp. NPDC088725]|uniref:ATP-binding protein n=1 Tax=Streptomyces sp. NPDC088725 TaxID=3365873 RepID=UPI00382E6AD6